MGGNICERKNIRSRVFRHIFREPSSENSTLYVPFQQQNPKKQILPQTPCGQIHTVFEQKYSERQEKNYSLLVKYCSQKRKTQILGQSRQLLEF